MLVRRMVARCRGCCCRFLVEWPDVPSRGCSCVWLRWSCVYAIVLVLVWWFDGVCVWVMSCGSTAAFKYEVMSLIVNYEMQIEITN